MRRIVILGAAGRDFHDFNVCHRDDAGVEVVAFTATQIPGISGRVYPPELAGPRYPQGIPIVPEDDLERIVRDRAVDEVVFAYSDVTHEHVMHLAARALAAGASFTLPGPRATMLPSRRPVVAVLATRTGAGKSTLSRYVVRALREAGRSPVAVRHPMPYEALHAGVERYATTQDVLGSGISVEAMEEYQQHVSEGTVVFAGVDYARILAAAEAEGDVIVWDGGNNDMAFYRPDITVTVVDPMRPDEEDRFFPGEVNVRSADIVVVNKVNAARAQEVEACMERVHRLNPSAPLVRMRSEETVADPAALRGLRVLAVDDGPSLTHGGMAEGVAGRAARLFGATLVDPRPWAKGSLAEAYDRFPHLGHVLPALGYGPAQLADLAASIRAVPCDAVLLGTPALLEAMLTLDRPTVRVGFEARDEGGPSLASLLLERLGPAAG